MGETRQQRRSTIAGKVSLGGISPRSGDCGAMAQSRGFRLFT
jgi:hypothetical protein